jgi:hypothetical protein
MNAEIQEQSHRLERRDASPFLAPDGWPVSSTFELQCRRPEADTEKARYGSNSAISGSAHSGCLARQLRAMSQRWTPRFESAGMSALRRCGDLDCRPVPIFREFCTTATTVHLGTTGLPSAVVTVNEWLSSRSALIVFHPWPRICSCPTTPIKPNLVSSSCVPLSTPGPRSVKRVSVRGIYINAEDHCCDVKVRLIADDNVENRLLDDKLFSL